MNNATTSAKGREELIDQLLYELHRLVFASNDLINRYSSKMGLHGKDGEALLQIWQAELAGAPLSPSELAEQLHITRAAVSYLTDRLMESGYVNRESNEADRRKTVLRISELGGQLGTTSLPLWRPVSAVYLPNAVRKNSPPLPKCSETSWNPWTLPTTSKIKTVAKNHWQN
ncbi:MarR family transcriptional regulator [Varibaculum cambriense]|nr:MarR family transcriptional regulator [Varibaculum cambriense]